MVSSNSLLHTFLGSLFLMLILMSLGGNCLVCAAIIWDKKLRKHKENLFLLSLAVSDLLVAVLVMCFAAANDLMGYWTFGRVYCALWISFDITCCTASILNMCAVAFDRYFHISRPLLYEEWLRRYRILTSILCIWLLSCVIGFIPFVFHLMGIHNADERNQSTSGTNSSANGAPVCRLDLKPVFAIISSLLSFYIPAAVMLFAYWKLYRCAQKHVQSIRAQVQQVTEALMSQTGRISRSGDLLAEAASRTDVSDHKARITLGVIIGAFLLCWLPFFCVNIATALAPGAVPSALFLGVTWLGYANSAANPVIYSILNRDFRNAFRSIICKLYGCCLEKKNRFGARDGEQERAISREFGEMREGDQLLRLTPSRCSYGTANNSHSAHNSAASPT